MSLLSHVLSVYINQTFACNVFGFFVEHFGHQHTIKNMKMKINKLCLWYTDICRWADDDW